MARTYYRDSKGRFAKRPGGGGGGSTAAKVATRAAATAVKKTSAATGTRIQAIVGGKLSTVSQAEAAAIMFGSAGARKRTGNKKRRR